MQQQIPIDELSRAMRQAAAAQRGEDLIFGALQLILGLIVLIWMVAVYNRLSNIEGYLRVARDADKVKTRLLASLANDSAGDKPAQ